MLILDGVIVTEANKATDGSLEAADIAFTATDKLLGRSSSGAGNGEEIALTSAGRAILDDANAAAQRTTLGLGDAATKGTTGADANAVSGTVGSEGEGLAWNADGDAVASGAVGRNLIINSNGASPINQRGVADGDAITTGDIVTDCWEVTHDATSIQYKNTNGGMGVNLVTAGAASEVELAQIVEDYADYQGLTLTLSASVISNDSAAALTIDDGVGTTSSSAHSGGGSAETLVVTRTIDGSASTLKALASLGTFSDGKYLEIVWIKLEFGSQRTMWYPPDYQQELAHSQRRFYKLDGTTQNAPFLAYGRAINSTTGRLTMWLPTPMRSTPTLDYSALSDFLYTNAGYSGNPTGLSVVSGYPAQDGDGNILAVGLTVADSGGNMTTDYPVILQGAGGATTFTMELSADL